jgi:hypothetical protein
MHRKITKTISVNHFFISNTLNHPNKLLKKVIKKQINNKLVFVVNENKG